ncbi:hypothetical protein L195_g025825 [Trifolium pratense]|uniref:Uncharacterized protein n=1 Tax=Trifolium pratense TaxID=57577 RepID=A0A2K3NHK1_TRIPR|nr:hypothetical protein L195_g025825 [Trifolium pratense]
MEAVIWNSQNHVIFARGTVSVESLVDKVKLSSCKWYLAKNPGNAAPSISGRYNRSCVGADSGMWAAGCVLVQVFVVMCFCSFGGVYF